MATNVFEKKCKTALPEKIKDILELLHEDLRASGGKPYGRGWKNFGPLPQLGDNVYHCHLDYHYVAVWRIEESEETINCFMTYVGTRENAPYK